MPAKKRTQGTRLKPGVKKGTRTKVFKKEDLPVPSGYYAEPKLTGLTPFHRAIARAWASGDFKEKKELAEMMGASPSMVYKLFEKRAFADEVDRIAAGIADHHADIADDVGKMAQQALEIYARYMESSTMSLREKKMAAKELIDWGIKLKGLDKTGDGRQKAEKIVNQQINIGEASEEQLRKIIGDETGLTGKKR